MNSQAKIDLSNKVTEDIVRNYLSCRRVKRRRKSNPLLKAALIVAVFVGVSMFVLDIIYPNLSNAIPSIRVAENPLPKLAHPH